MTQELRIIHDLRHSPSNACLPCNVPPVALGRASAYRTLTSILITIKLCDIKPLPAMVSLMYVCLCVGVTDGQIRDAIYEGCCSYKEVRAATNVGTQCGKCACLAKEVVRETLTKLQVSQAALPYPVEFTAA